MALYLCADAINGFSAAGWRLQGRQHDGFWLLIDQ